MLTATCFSQVADHVEKVRESQRTSFPAAALLLVDTIAAKGRTFVFGSGHSNLLIQECCLRAGGLRIYNPIFIAGLLPTDYPYLRCGLMKRISGIAAAALDTARIRKGDTIIVISNSGRNHVPIEMAMESRKRGLQVIVLTSVSFSSPSQSRHPSGRRLYELANVVLDNCCTCWRCRCRRSWCSAKIGPLSTIIGAVMLHALSCQVAEILIERGLRPPVFASGNVDGGDEYAKEIVESYRELIAY